MVGNAKTKSVLPDAKEKREALYLFHEAIDRAYKMYEDPDVALAATNAVSTFEYELSTTKHAIRKAYAYEFTDTDKCKVEILKQQIDKE